MAFHLNTVFYKFFCLLLLNSLKLIVCLYVTDWYLLGVHLKFPDEHPRPFYMGVPPPPLEAARVRYMTNRTIC